MLDTLAALENFNSMDGWVDELGLVRDVEWMILKKALLSAVFQGIN